MAEKETRTIFDSLGDKPSEQSISDFIDYFDDEIRRIHNQFLDKNIKGKLKLSLEAIMHKIIYTKTMAKEKFTQDNVSFQSIHSLFKSRLNTGMVVNLKNIDPISFLNNSKDFVLNFIRDIRNKHHCLKVNLTFFGDFELQGNNEEK